MLSLKYACKCILLKKARIRGEKISSRSKSPKKVIGIDGAVPESEGTRADLSAKGEVTVSTDLETAIQRSINPYTRLLVDMGW